MLDKLQNPPTPHWLAGAALSMLRVMTGALFMQHGAQKMLGMLLPADRTFNGAPALFSQIWFAGVLELVGGALIVLGLFSRPVAFLLSGEMAVAYFQAHAPRNLFPILNGGEGVLLFCFVFFYLFAVGGGPYSLDAILFGHRDGQRGRP